MAKEVKISSWGNCLAIRIPQFIVDNLDIKAGEIAELSYTDNKIVIVLDGKLPEHKTAAEIYEEQIIKNLHDSGVPGY